MPERKDWRNFEKRREDALQREAYEAQANQPPYNDSNYAYDNQAYLHNNYDHQHQGPRPGKSNNSSRYRSPNSDIQPMPLNYPNEHGYRRGEQLPQQVTSPISEHQDIDNNNPIAKRRKCRDVAWLLLFGASISIMIAVVGYALKNGSYSRITNGIDFNCDSCGEDENPFIQGVLGSGKNQSQRKFSYSITSLGQVYYEPDTNKSIRNLIAQECKSECPTDFKIVLNRCVPTNSSRQSKFHPINSLKGHIRADPINEVSTFFEEFAEDIENHWKNILWICLIALGIAILITILLRLFAGIIIWFVVIGVSLGAIAGSIALWILWTQKKEDPKWSSSEVTSLMIGAICVSIITVFILLLLLGMRKRISLVIKLFNEAGKAVHAMPLLLFQPILTFVSLSFTLGVWLAIAILIESSGQATQENSESGTLRCFYKKDTFTLLSRWWNLFMMTWMTQFILGCQHMIVAGAVSIWFFSRNKNRIGFPILKSYSRLLRYHLGSIALGSLIIAIVKMIRYILNTIQKRLGGANAFCKALLCCCKCCIWLLEKFLNFLNRNAYIEIAIHGYGFCKSARKAFKLIMNNALRLAAINSIGDFVLFLGKISIVGLSCFAGYELLKHKETINHVWIPIGIGGIFAYFIAHCFISVYEMAIDTVFICFCEDCAMNDGIAKPYYMSKGLMEFVKNSEKALKEKKKQKKTPK